jgi:hypothetical protein
MLKHSILVISLLAAVGACKKKEEAAKTDTTAVAPVGDKQVADKPPETKPAAPAGVINPGPSPSNDKEWLGLELPPMGAWKPEWDPDAKVAKWSNDDYMTGIVIRVVKDKLDGIEDLKEAAPMMMQLGTAVSKVVEEGKTPKGWWAIVEMDEGKSTNMVYVQKFTDSQIVCSGNLTPKKDVSSPGGIKKEEVLTACESVKVKG